MQFRISNRWFVGLLGLFLLATPPAIAQFKSDEFQLIPELSQVNSGPPDADLKVQSQVRVAPGSKLGMLEVTATMDDSWHVYSLTQPAGGPMRSEVKLDEGGYQLLGSFAPDHAPHIKPADVFPVESEEFPGKVTWSVPIAITGAVSELKIGGHVDGQVCADGGACIPFGKEETRFEAQPTGKLGFEEAKTLDGFRLKGTHADIRAWLSTNTVAPGDTVVLHVAFQPDPDWHVYAYAKLPPSLFQKPTLIHAALPNGWKTGQARSSAPIISEQILKNDPPVRYYEGAATISMPITIPKTAKPGKYPLSGHVAYQTCAQQCDRPTAIAWKSELTVAESAVAQRQLGSVAFDSTPVSYDAVVELIKLPAKTSENTRAPGGIDSVAEDSSDAPNVATSLADLEFEDEEQTNKSLVGVLLAAFVGGFVLNFMPCVLPVIGLKILSFVDQAGADRVKAFSLNAWYALGMLAIFWILAALAAAPALGLSENGLGWGEQFNYQEFAIPLVCVVFVMALSFLGVWEIPIPGFATSGKVSELSQQEGYSGAFFKGSITTILATPCSAPGLAAAYAFAVNSRSPTLPFLIFTVMGLGMAIPYLIIGAFPSLIRFLPKPGPWMDTFKQLMGFVLLATVVFLLQNITFANLLPTVSMLFGLWFACWWIGRVPLTAEKGKRLRAWGVAGVISLAAVVISFGKHVDAFGMTFSGLLGKAQSKYDLTIDRALSEHGGVTERTVQMPKSNNSLPWEPYSTELLEDAIADGYTVLVDFTADW